MIKSRERTSRTVWTVPLGTTALGLETWTPSSVTRATTPTQEPRSARPVKQATTVIWTPPAWPTCTATASVPPVWSVRLEWPELPILSRISVGKATTVPKEMWIHTRFHVPTEPSMLNMDWSKCRSVSSVPLECTVSLRACPRLLGTVQGVIIVLWVQQLQNPFLVPSGSTEMDQPRNPSKIVQNVSLVFTVTEKDWPPLSTALLDLSVSVEVPSRPLVPWVPTVTPPTCVEVPIAHHVQVATTVMALEELLQLMYVIQGSTAEKRPTPRLLQMASRVDSVLQEATVLQGLPHLQLVLWVSTVRVQGPRPSLIVFLVTLDSTVLVLVVLLLRLSVLLDSIVLEGQESPHSSLPLLDTTPKKEPLNLNPAQQDSSSLPKSPPSVICAVKGTTVMELVQSIRFSVLEDTTVLRAAAILLLVLEEHSWRTQGSMRRLIVTPAPLGMLVILWDCLQPLPHALQVTTVPWDPTWQTPLVKHLVTFAPQGISVQKELETISISLVQTEHTVLSQVCFFVLLYFDMIIS